MPPPPDLDEIDALKEDPVNLKDQYIKNVKYGISSIDTNMSLKRFIVNQNEKKT